MANSKKLSKLHTNISVTTEESLKLEVRLKKAVENAMVKFTKKTGIEVIRKGQLKKKDIMKELNSINKQFGRYLSNPNSNIRPDGGGLVSGIYGNKEHLLLVSEAKKQGTNDVIVKAGGKRQPMGNAIERATKNYAEVCLFQKFHIYTPYVVFGSGCDFVEGSSIRDRISTITSGRKYNKIHVKNEIINGVVFQGGSVFLKVEMWTAEEMSAIAYKMMLESHRYILKEINGK